MTASPSRMRRFCVGGAYDRRFVSSDLVPALVRGGVLSRDREHNNVAYRLSDAAKDDASRLIEDGEVPGR